MKAVIICASGMSASLVKSLMNKYAEEAGVDLQVFSDSYENLPFIISEYDLFLFAPQVAMHFEDCRSQYMGSGKVFGLLSVREFGSMNGCRLVERSLEMYEEKYQDGKMNLDKEMLEMIGAASEGRRLAFEAFDCIENRQYNRAKQCIRDGRKAVLPAHQIQSQLIALQMDPLSKGKVDVTLLAVHAQNHLMLAEQALDMVERMIGIFAKRNNRGENV